jgi:peptide deformylase
MAASIPAPMASEPDPDVLARRDAAMAHVLLWGDPILRTAARPIDDLDDEVLMHAGRMRRIMVDALGVGLAAPQVGVLRRLMVYRVPGERADDVRTLVNPAVEHASDETAEFEEGCLSLPGIVVAVTRPRAVRVRGLDERGEERLIEAEDAHASLLQHEIDHLDGTLVLDRLDREARRAAVRALRERATGAS